MTSTTASPLSKIIPVGDLAWEERQPGIRAKSLWADAVTKRRAVMTRIEPGSQLPLHRHVGDELVFVIEGAIADEFGTVTAGNVGYRPNGRTYRAIASHAPFSWSHDLCRGRHAQMQSTFAGF